jgi:serine beta-lactamase-like protein LACTB, mitochondrial
MNIATNRRPTLQQRTATALAALLLSGCQSAGMPDSLRNEWSTAGCPGAVVRGGARERQASEALRRALAEDNGAGATAAIVIDGHLVWSEAFGQADGRGAALTTGAQIRIGSVAKGFTAAIIARLHETRGIDLDAPIQTYVPNFPPKAHEISLRQLATHTSGVRHYDFSNFDEANNTRHYERLSDALGVFADDPLVTEPGAAVTYSSLGYNLIGVAAENIMGVPYGEALRQTVIEPLGLSSVALDDAAVRNPCRPVFYTNALGRLRVPTIWRDSSDYYPSGGLLATSEDLARFAYATFATDAFGESARSLFTQTPTLANGEQGQFAFAWQVERDANGEVAWYGLGGAANGAHASVRYYPRLRMAVAGAINYNFYLTERRPAFFRAVREEIPAIYGAN